MAVQLFSNRQAMVEAFNDFLGELPSDTQAIQVAVFAYTDTYDNYDDKQTKCVKEGDIWWNLSAEDQMELLSEAVTTTLKKVAEFEAFQAETETDMALKEEAANEINVAFKRLARSFVFTLGAEATDNLETAAYAEEQLERLFEGVIGFDNRRLYQLLVSTFQKKKALAEVLDNMTWKMMSAKKAQAKKPQPKQIGKPNIPQPRKPIQASETQVPGVTPTSDTADKTAPK